MSAERARMPLSAAHFVDDGIELVERVKNGDREAFMTLTQRYQKKIYIVAYSFFRNKEDALDIVRSAIRRKYL
jgi:RNA polymerase sigma-70 factor (ECF subfamily)